MRRGVLLVAALCASCSYGDVPEARVDYVVSYAGQATVLDPDATAVVARAAATAARTRPAHVVVAGYADDPGAPEANQIQSRLRAQSVADALVADGVARSLVSLEPRRALGGDPAIESRRVDIRLQPR